MAGRCRRRWSVALATPFLAAAIGLSDEDSLAGVLLLVLVVAAQVLGDSRRQRSRRSPSATRPGTLAETQRDQAVMEERARIARELHDVVAHHVSMIAVQAETARLTTPGMPEEGRSGSARSARRRATRSTEMRRLLGVLRADGEPGPPARPSPGSDASTSCSTARATAGTPVRLTLEGDVAPLPPGVDLTAYRIVQEALTNARRHAPGAAVEVDARLRGGRASTARARRRAGPSAADTSGHGLVGMRERATMVGGRSRPAAATAAASWSRRSSRSGAP